MTVRLVTESRVRDDIIAQDHANLTSLSQF